MGQQDTSCKHHTIPYYSNHRISRAISTTMADNLRDQTAQRQNPTFIERVSKEEAVLGDKAVGGTDDDADHVPNVERGLKAEQHDSLETDYTAECGRVIYGAITLFGPLSQQRVIPSQPRSSRPQLPHARHGDFRIEQC